MNEKILRRIVLIFQAKLFWSINLGVFLMLVLFFLLFVREKEIVFFPNRQPLLVSTFSDQEINKSSLSKLIIQSDTLIDYQFRLGPIEPYRYAGINIENKEQKELDISAYNRIAIDFTAYDMDNMFLYLNVKDTNVKNGSHKHALRRMLANFPIDPKRGRQRVVIPFDKMDTPAWWYQSIQQSKSDFREPDWKTFHSMAISDGVNLKENYLYRFKLHKIVFLKDYTSSIVGLSFIQLCTLALSSYFFLYRKLKSQPETKKIEITYKSVSQVNHGIQKQGNDFIAYIHEHYADPELSLTSVSKATNTDKQFISDTISSEFNCNFKTYINGIRITEARRLLKESDYRINEIAYKVGFNSPIHFNRVFKNLTGITPSEYSQNP